MALNSLYCADVPLSNYSLTHAPWYPRMLCHFPNKRGITTHTELLHVRYGHRLTNMLAAADTYGIQIYLTNK